MDSNTHNKAVATFVLGIIAAVFAFFGWGAFIGLACGIVGIVLAKKAKEAGNTEGILQAGFICSIVGTAISGVSVLIIVFFGSLFASMFI